MRAYALISQVSTVNVGVVIRKEDEWYVAIDPLTGVASQGKNLNEALKNFQEAIKLWFENAEKWEREQTIKVEPVATMIIEIKV